MVGGAGQVVRSGHGRRGRGERPGAGGRVEKGAVLPGHSLAVGCG